MSQRHHWVPAVSGTRFTAPPALSEVPAPAGAAFGADSNSGSTAFSACCIRGLLGISLDPDGVGGTGGTDTLDEILESLRNGGAVENQIAEFFNKRSGKDKVAAARRKIRQAATPEAAIAPLEKLTAAVQGWQIRPGGKARRRRACSRGLLSGPPLSQPMHFFGEAHRRRAGLAKSHRREGKRAASMLSRAPERASAVSADSPFNFGWALQHRHVWARLGKLRLYSTLWPGRAGGWSRGAPGWHGPAASGSAERGLRLTGFD